MPATTFFFGSSMNPPTKAHIAIVQYFSEQFPEATILVAPIYRHILAGKVSSLADYGDRFRMSQLAFREFSNVVVSDVELQVSEKLVNQALTAPDQVLKIGTIDVLSHLQAANPDTEFNLILGLDTARDLLADKWKQSSSLLEQVTAIYVLSRDGVTIRPDDIAEQYRAKFFRVDLGNHDPEITHASSTKARNGDSNCVSVQILTYMQENKMYSYSATESYKLKM